MTNQVLLKRSSVQAKVPATADLVLGELAVNTYDGKLFLKKNNGADAVVEIGQVYTVAGRTGDVVLTNADVGLGSVENKSSATIRSELTSSNVTTALGFTPADNAKLGIASGIATLDSSGKLASGQIPAIAITDTFVVASQTDMLALVAQTGDVAVRSDLNKSFILKGSDPTVLANWQELLTPTDAVQSVNGFTGTVTLSTSNINEGTNLYFTNARASSAAPVQSVAGRTGAIVLAVADVSGAAPLTSPALTGTPTAPTATTADSSTTIATTAFVKAQNYVTTTAYSNGTIDGGAY